MVTDELAARTRNCRIAPRQLPIAGHLSCLALFALQRLAHDNNKLKELLNVYWVCAAGGMPPPGSNEHPRCGVEWDRIPSKQGVVPDPHPTHTHRHAPELHELSKWDGAWGEMTIRATA